LKNILADYWPQLLIALTAVIIMIIIAADLQMKNMISKEAELLLNAGGEVIVEESTPIKEADLEGLPEPAAKWLRYTGAVGQHKISTLKLSQRGQMRLEPDQEKWLDAEAEQYINVKEPGYLWHVDLPILPLINTKGRDLFYKGQGSMLIKIASLIAVVDEGDNPKLDESSYHRFLLELAWYPTAALEDYISWNEIDSESAEAVFSYNDLSVKATFYFEEDGRLTRIESMRYKDNDEDAERIPCIGEIRSYMTVDGLQIPNKIDVSWVIDGERFTWYKLEIFDLNIYRS